MRPPHDARLLPAALAWWVVTLGCVLYEGLWSRVILGGATVLCLSLILLRRRRARRLKVAALHAALVAFAVLGSAGLAHVHDAHRASGGVQDALAQGQEVTWRGTVVREPAPAAARYTWGGEPSERPARWRVRVHLSAWRLGSGGEHLCDVNVIVWGAEEWGSLAYGDTVEFRGLPERLSGREELASFSRAVVVTTSGAVGWQRLVAQSRGRFVLATEHLPDHTRGLVRGMVMGDTSTMPATQRDDMRVSGLAHLTAVSGAHFAVIFWAVGALVRRATVPRLLRGAILGCAGLAFVLFVHLEPSVQRAGWMGAVAVLALWWGRPAQALPALCGAVIGLLALNPWLATSAGFALSVVATAAIALWSPVLTKVLQRRCPPSVARVLAVPIAAFVCCAPLLVLLAPGVGVYGVIANVFAVPFIVPVTVLGLVAVMVASLSPPAAAPFVSVVDWCARVVAWIAETAAHAPGAWLPWPGGVPGALLMAVASASIVLAVSLRRVPGWWRIAVAAVVVGALLGTPGVRAATGWGGGSAPADWSVVACDVGQGDMLLVRVADHEAVVIDTGVSGGGGAQCLRTFGVTSIPLLVLTHAHADHIGALSELDQVASIGQLWAHDASVSAGNVGAVLPAVGTTWERGSARVSVLARGGQSGVDDTELNDSSIVVWAQSGGVTLLALGDLEYEGQARLARTLAQDVTVDLVKVAHHGSARQEPALAAMIHARAAIVSVGENNYGHPSDQALSLYGEHSTVYRTDECGNIAFSRRHDLVVHARCA